MTLRSVPSYVLLGLAALLLVAQALAAPPPQTRVRLKDLGHIDGLRENALVGYGLVTGLAGSGDSFRNRGTTQAVANMLSQFGLYLNSEQVQSRNVAAVMITATLPPFARPGAKVDVLVTSLGDARSLVGGALLMTPLKGPDSRIRALAQGPVSVGGYSYDQFGNVVQKNHPTSGTIPGGAVIELGVNTQVVSPTGTVQFVLDSADYTTAQRVAESINAAFDQRIARARDASSIEVIVPEAESQGGGVQFLTRLENVQVAPDQRAKVVVNERTGVVVAGGDVRISQVTISHGELKVSITTDYLVSQPYPPLVGPGSPGARTQVVPQTRIDVAEPDSQSVSLPGNNTVADLVRALAKIRTSPRDMIAILQGMKSAGALHADLIVQ